MGASGTTGADAALDDRSVRILAFEARSWPDADAKSEAIRHELGLSGARYYRLLSGIIEQPAALRHDPLLVNRLLRLRDARVAARALRTPTPGRPLD
ncbi:DUF3263 domain-containing protein [Agromyces sp. NPDC060279]|uniref:DUF3263 domain-containing protein n=1 Tax=Agromyces sp. NPDC060279 TaxID=3347092 RepID=UPI003647E91D